MFLPNNTFLFKARDRRVNHGVLENLADWLNWVTDKNLETIGRIVVCTKHLSPMIEFAWKQSEYESATAGFVVSDRIDYRVGDKYKNKHGHEEWNYESWGKEDGHHCTQNHFEMVFPKAEAKKLAMKLAKEKEQDEESVIELLD
jgi:hypothetical protein